MPDLRPEIHVGDVGTLYRAKVYSDQVAFDPSTASVKQLIFKLPGGVVLTKTATVTDDGLSPAESWYLTYAVQANDGAGSPPGDFHALPGPVRIQAYLEWADGSSFHSDVQTVDEDGRELRIFRNITT